MSNVFDEPPETVCRRPYQAPSSLTTFDRDFKILRAILANGMILDGYGPSNSGAVLMDCIETVMYNRITIFEVYTKELLLLLLMAWNPCVKQSLRNTSRRATTLFITAKKQWPIDTLELRRKAFWRCASIVITHGCAKVAVFQVISDGHGRSSTSGVYTIWIVAGVTVLGCLLPYKMLIWTLSCLGSD